MDDCGFSVGDRVLYNCEPNAFGEVLSTHWIDGTWWVKVVFDYGETHTVEDFELTRIVVSADDGSLAAQSVLHEVEMGHMSTIWRGR